MGRVAGEQSNVQHSLGDGLLGGVPVGVQLGLQQGGDYYLCYYLELRRQLTLMIVFFYFSIQLVSNSVSI